MLISLYAGSVLTVLRELVEDNMSKIVSLSGYEGSGKTTLLKDVALHVPGLIVVPEVARLLLPVSTDVMQKPAGDISFSTFVAYLSALHIMQSNRIDKALFDRNIIDSLVYMQIFSPGQALSLTSVNNHIKRYLDEHDQDALFDTVVLLKHPTDPDFIRDSIMADKQRMYSDSVSSYLSQAAAWNGCYINTFSQLDNVARNFMYVDCYPNNPGLCKELTQLLNKGGL